MIQTAPARGEFLRLSGIGFGPHAIVGDVLGFALKGDWPGRFRFVKVRLHAGFFNGEKAYFIRTAASDQAYAQAEGLAWAPLLNAAEKAQAATANLYVFDDGAPDQLPLLSTVPSRANYSPLWRVYKVKPKGTTLYDWEEKLKAAEAAGEVTIEAENIFVNYPVVNWPGGEMPVDTEKAEFLGGG